MPRGYFNLQVDREKRSELTLEGYEKESKRGCKSTDHVATVNGRAELGPSPSCYYTSSGRFFGGLTLRGNDELFSKADDLDISGGLTITGLEDLDYGLAKSDEEPDFSVTITGGVQVWREQVTWAAGEGGRRFRVE